MSAQDFDAQITRWLQKVEQRRTMLFVNTANATKNSITEGSAVTGAPGQPVDTGTLKASWVLAWDDPTHALIATNIAYAPVIEENSRAAYDERGDPAATARRNPDGSWRRPVKSIVGGHHSVKLTHANFDALVRDELVRVLRETGGD